MEKREELIMESENIKNLGFWIFSIIIPCVSLYGSIHFLLNSSAHHDTYGSILIMVAVGSFLGQHFVSELRGNS